MGNDEGRDPRPQSIGAYLYDELRRAFQDVRQRVVEEGWFGRITTPLQRDHHSIGQTGPESPSSERAITFDDLWPPRPEAAKDQAQDRDHGIDR